MNPSLPKLSLGSEKLRVQVKLLGEEAYEYAVLNHQLMDLFATDCKITVMPNYHLRIKESDFNNRSDSVRYCVPDFYYKIQANSGSLYLGLSHPSYCKVQANRNGSDNFQRNFRTT